MVQIKKSSRHSKITGDFAEYLVMYWLSKHGFECSRVDHTGIDLIARNPHTKELMGISVKSRSRNPGTEKDSINIHATDLQKALIASEAFGCRPYFVIVADVKDRILAFILSSDKLKTFFRENGEMCAWKMDPGHIEQYSNDSEIKIFELRTNILSWWG